MTPEYAPDLAPDLEPRVVRWQPAHPAGAARAHVFSADAVALAMVVMGALAVGAVAIAALAAGRTGEGRGRFRMLDLDGLDVGRLRRRPF